MPQLTSASTTPDLMGIVTRQITPDVIRNAASTLHEDRGSTASALSTAVPSVLTALSEVASSDIGARHLKEVIDEKRRSSQLADDDRSLFPPGADVAGDHAAGLIDDELGPRSSSIAAAVANASGIKEDSAHKLMGGVATVAVAALAKTSSGMGPGALRSILREQRGQWVRRLPAPVASLFNGHGGPAGAAAAAYRGFGYYDERILTGPAIRELEAPRRSWMIPVILVALALLAIPLLRGLRRQRVPALPTPPALTQPVPQPSATPPVEATPAPAPEATAPAPEATAPAPEAANIEPGSIADMAAFLGGTGEMTPQAFAPTPLNFAFGSAKPTDASTKTIDQIADLLKQHPAAAIRIESHTDNVGTAPSNLDLSQARAEAIKNELTDRGVDGSRIETAGLGQEMPIASNDTAEGRAKNRRSEIIVTAR